MSKSQAITGYCPTQDKDFSVSVNYIPHTDLQTIHYSKGRMTCNYASFGGKCSIECPLYKSAPENI